MAVAKGTVDREGRIKYKFAEGVEIQIELTYKEYKGRFDKEIENIQFEELMNSKEALMIKTYCKEGKK